MKIPAECSSLRAVNLGSSAFPIYHGNGLLPALPTSATKIVAPNQRVRKGFWGVRTLTNNELGHAYDIGDRMLGFVPMLSKFFTPLAILRVFLSAVADTITGGDSFWFTSKRGSDRVITSTEDDCKKEEKGSPSKRRRCEVTGKTPSERTKVMGETPGERTEEESILGSDTLDSDMRFEEEEGSSQSGPNAFAAGDISVLRETNSGPSLNSLSEADVPTMTWVRVSSKLSKLSAVETEHGSPGVPEGVSRGSRQEAYVTRDSGEKTGDSTSSEQSINSTKLIDQVANTAAMEDGQGADAIALDGDQKLDDAMEDGHGAGAIALDGDQEVDEQSRDKRERKATKSDDAPVPTWLWRDHLIADGPTPWSEAQVLKGIGLDKAMDITRDFLLLKWKRLTARSFQRWWSSQHRSQYRAAQRWSHAHSDIQWNGSTNRYEWANGSQGRSNFQTWYLKRYKGCKDFDAGRDCLYRVAHSSWWDWSAGSRPMFWRWPKDARRGIRDGMMVFFMGESPVYSKPQQRHTNPTTKPLVESKLQKVIDRGYLDNDQVIVSLTSFFPVDKGEDDIRMVYDGTKCGLNDSVWVPSFMMPTLASHMRAVVEGTNMCDVDIGECFLNFMLYPELRILCGIDLGPYDLDFSSLGNPFTAPQLRNKRWLAWNRAAMGMKWSPYQAVRSMHFAEEVIRGNRHDETNVFGWTYVRCNLPGQDDYDPSLPWISKVKALPNGTIQVAADLFTFVDDCRPTGSTSKEAWLAGRRTASIVNWLGCQDAPRKRRDSRTDPGAWAGTLIRTEGGIYALVSDDKWQKFKSQIFEIDGMLVDSPNSLPRKRLEQIRGFLNYVVQTYRPMIPYLNGLHMTIDGWREGRDEEGWRLPPSADATYASADTEGRSNDVTQVVIPDRVSSVPRLRSDINALLRLSQSESAPCRRIRPKFSASVLYGFGDASGTAFGATSQFQHSSDIHFQFGQWLTSVTKEESSNWREFTNLVEYLEERGAEGQLFDSEVFMFTDNSTAEAAFWKGTSKSRKLLDLVLRLRELEMQTGMILHIIHVSGKRMIAQGTDGLSRGDHSTGVMTGQSLTAFVPIHLDAFQRSPPLREWMEQVLSQCNAKFLSPEGWFENHTAHDTFVWSPPPAAADVVVERFGIARHKRPNTLHVLLIPRLMTGRWRKMLAKHTDRYFRITWNPIWNMKDQFEPLLMFVALPFLPHQPRFQERSDLVDGLERALCDPELQEISPSSQRDLLCQLLGQARSLRSM